MEGRATEGLRKLGLALPSPPVPQGSYAPAVRVGDQVFVSGQGAMRDGKPLYRGRVEADVSLAQAQEAARLATLQGLSAVGALVGSVDKIRRALRVAVYVASSPGFTRQHEVGNGATELLLALLGEEGRPARVSLGVTSLPLDFPVEVEMLLLVE
ncbi:MAG: RidA family protein [Thermoplasmata archaeon]|nr:RidA family protein [Thermoplasmata archaeon]